MGSVERSERGEVLTTNSVGISDKFGVHNPRDRHPLTRCLIAPSAFLGSPSLARHRAQGRCAALTWEMGSSAEFLVLSQIEDILLLSAEKVCPRPASSSAESQTSHLAATWWKADDRRPSCCSLLGSRRRRIDQDACAITPWSVALLFLRAPSFVLRMPVG